LLFFKRILFSVVTFRLSGMRQLSMLFNPTDSLMASAARASWFQPVSPVIEMPGPSREASAHLPRHSQTEEFGALFLSSVYCAWQLHHRQPEIVDALHDIETPLKVHRLGDIAVRMEQITPQNVLLRR
jgi:hypothetical protein